MNSAKNNSITFLNTKTVNFFALPFLAFLFLSPPLCGQTVEENRIELYGRIWGMMKYYHPTIQKDKINWDSVFAANYNSFKDAADTLVYNQLVSSLLDTVGRIRKKGKPYKHFPKDTTVCNLHFKWIDATNLLTTKNKNALNDIIRYYQPRKNKTTSKEAVKLRDKENKEWNTQSPCPNETLSMLALFSYWNRINYCFAYKDLMDIPWEQTLKEFIPRLAKAANSKEFYFQMAELITRINDSHAGFRNYELSSGLGLSKPIQIRYAEGKTLVADISDSLSKLFGFRRGDEIITCNGVLIQERREYLRKYSPAGNKGREEFVINNRVLGLQDTGFFTYNVIDVLGNTKEVIIRRDSVFNKQLRLFLSQEPATTPYKLIAGKYGYIDGGIATTKNIRKAYKKFSSSTAIILDLRKYGRGSERPLLKHLLTRNFTYLHFYIQRDKFPGVYKKIGLTAIPFSILPFYRKFKGDVLVLIDEQSASWMESLSMQYKLAGFTLIGRNTAGTDGDNQPFSFWPGFLTAFTKNAITYPDGTPTQRIGIVPSIYVKATCQDVKQGKDEILEKAIQYLDAKQKKRAE